MADPLDEQQTELVNGVAPTARPAAARTDTSVAALESLCERLRAEAARTRNWRLFAEATDVLTELLMERKAKNLIDPVTRLHNICDAMAGDRADSPYSQESWELADADNKQLRDENAALKSAMKSVEATLHSLAFDVAQAIRGLARQGDGHNASTPNAVAARALCNAPPTNSECS